MLLLALGGEASRAPMDLLELGRPAGKLRLTGKQLASSSYQRSPNVTVTFAKLHVSAVERFPTRRSRMEKLPGEQGVGLRGRRHFVEDSLPFAWAGFVLLSLLITCVVFPPTTVDLGGGAFQKTKANLCFW